MCVVSAFFLDLAVVLYCVLLIPCHVCCPYGYDPSQTLTWTFSFIELHLHFYTNFVYLCIYIFICMSLSSFSHWLRNYFATLLWPQLCLIKPQLGTALLQREHTKVSTFLSFFSSWMIFYRTYSLFTYGHLHFLMMVQISWNCISIMIVWLQMHE